MPSFIFDNSSASQMDRAMYVPVPDGNIYVQEFGPRHAPVLYYVHSGPGYHSQSFRELMGDVLTQYRVLYVDQRGGGSSHGVGGEQPEVLQRDILAVLDALEIDTVALLTHGFGTLPAILFATAHPERVTHLIMMNPWVSLPQLAADLYRAALELSGQPVPDDIPPGDAQLVDMAFQLVNPKQLLDSMQFPKIQSRLHLEHIDSETVLVHDETEDIDMLWDVDVSAKLAECTFPVVVIAGQYDKTSYPSQVQLVLEAQPNALVAFFEAGHYLFVDEPLELAEVITQAVEPGN